MAEIQDIDPRDWQVPEHEEAVFHGRKNEFALVIPVINEGERIHRQLQAIAALRPMPSLDIIIADGGSTDGSLEPVFLQSCSVRALLTKTGPGKLSAQLRMAYAFVLREGYRGVVTIDGNGKDDVSALATMVAKLGEGFDYVQGSRYAKGGKAINTPFLRWFAGRFIHAPVISLATRQWYTDTTNGFRAYSARYLSDWRVQPFREIFNEYNLLFYLSIRANQLGYRSCEIGVTRAYPADGRVPTKIRGMRGPLRLMKELFLSALGRFDP
jgi:dolichol-phosphate mannosyltransferase